MVFGLLCFGSIYSVYRLIVSLDHSEHITLKGWGNDFFDALAKVDAEFDGRSLVERKKGTEESNSGGGLPSWYTN